MTRLGRTTGRALAALAALLLAAGCNDSTTRPSMQGNLEVRLTDAPIDGVAQINVYITGVTVKPAAGPVERIVGDVGLVDLLSLRGSSQLLARAGVAPGEYEFVQIDLDQDRSNLVLDAGRQVLPLRIASQEVKVLGGFTVTAQAATVLTLDFDAAASLRREGNGNYLLVPVIVQAGAST